MTKCHPLEFDRSDHSGPYWMKSKPYVMRTQDGVMTAFYHMRNAVSQTRNYRSEDGILHHYNTVEGFYGKNGVIFQNMDCWARGFAKCSFYLTNKEQSTSKYAVISLNLLYAHTRENQRWAPVDPKKISFQGGNRILHDEDVIFEYEGKVFHQYLQDFSGYCRLYVMEDLTTKKKFVRVNRDDIRDYDDVKKLYERRLKRRVAYWRYLTKTPFNLATLEKVGFETGYSPNAWRVEVNKNCIVYDRGDNIGLIVQDGLTLPSGAQVFKLILVGNYSELSKLIVDENPHAYPGIRDVALCGKDEVGQFWLLHLPYWAANWHIPACERWILNMDKDDILVEQT